MRSYGLYLWHWPIFVLTRPGLDVPLTGWPLLVLRLGMTFVLADLSYRLVETPDPQGAHRPLVRRSARPARGNRAALASAAAVVLVGAVWA